MSEHAGFVALAYGVAVLTIGGMAARIIFEYRRLKAALSRFEGRDKHGDAS